MADSKSRDMSKWCVAFVTAPSPFVWRMYVLVFFKIQVSNISCKRESQPSSTLTPLLFIMLIDRDNKGYVAQRRKEILSVAVAGLGFGWCSCCLQALPILILRPGFHLPNCPSTHSLVPTFSHLQLGCDHCLCTIFSFLSSRDTWKAMHRLAWWHTQKQQPPMGSWRNW